jgi:Ca2+-binding EF-hand superfamily protein
MLRRRAGRRLFGHSLRDTYAAFRAFDRDGSGLLSQEEFRWVMQSASLAVHVHVWLGTG